MAVPPADIRDILAALSSGGTPAQIPPQPPGNTGYPNFPTPSNPGPYALPQPVSTGNVDLSNIRPIHSGSVSLNEVAENSRGYGNGKGFSYEDGRNLSYNDRDPRNRQQRSRSRSRSPQRGGRDTFRNNYNPYIDERREEQRHLGTRNYRDRSFSPGVPGLPNRPPVAMQYGTKGDSMSNAGGNDQGTETISVESNLVGLIIGRAGENLRRVEADTQTRVQFMAAGADGNSAHRMCKITGSRAAREHAKGEIARIIEENGNSNRVVPDRQASVKQPGSQQPALRSGEDSTQMMVPNRTVGLIIGRGGETIKDIQERSGCHVNILSEDKSLNGLRPVNLIGTKDAAGFAKELILEIVDSDNKSMAQGNQSGQSGQSGQNNSRSSMSMMENQNEKINDSITVPSEAVGMIIGKNGETIKDMQNVTLCKINVSQPSGRDIEREIGLIGTRSAIEHAKHAIMEKVRAVEEKNRRTGRSAQGQQDRNTNNQSTYSSERPSSNYDQRYPQYGQQQSSSEFQPNAQPGQQAPTADLYEAYGGYDNYMAMWTAYYASQNQGQGQPGTGQPS